MVIIFNQKAVVIDRIKRADFDSEDMNQLATEAAFDLTKILEQAEVLTANADQAPHDAWRAQMLVEFIENSLPEILEPSESDESRVERLADAARKDRQAYGRNLIHPLEIG